MHVELKRVIIMLFSCTFFSSVACTIHSLFSHVIHLAFMRVVGIRWCAVLTFAPPPIPVSFIWRTSGPNSGPCGPWKLQPWGEPLRPLPLSRLYDVLLLDAKPFGLESLRSLDEPLTSIDMSEFNSSNFIYRRTLVLSMVLHSPCECHPIICWRMVHDIVVYD